MSTPDPTSWPLIRAAAAGSVDSRDEFARLFAPAVREQLLRRWRQTPLADSMEDALQEVFVECFRRDGVLASADRDSPASFRGLIFPVCILAVLVAVIAVNSLGLW